MAIGIGDVLAVSIFEAVQGGLYVPISVGSRPGNFVELPPQAVNRMGNISIPFAGGWSLSVDGIAQPMFSAHLGMLATDIGAGPHRIELRYALPGFVPGLLISLAGLIAWPVVVLAGRRKSGLA